MVSFSSLIRSKAKCSDLLSCFLDLNNLEITIFYTLLSRGRATLDDLAAIVSRDRSTVFRNLQKLDSLGLVSKEMTSLDRGGRVSIFVPSDIPTIKEIISQRIESIKRSMDSFLNEFEQRMNLEMVIYGDMKDQPHLKSVKSI
jgi:predicted transcriptional regulator